ncbi:MAG TPA: HlyD family secretion protein, partial [Kofleriaceae bacterium]|nr:HlyD family secretion protein [Kofleriaceae bacterium]
VLVVAGVIAAAAWRWWPRGSESTDDAFIEGRIVAVSPTVPGRVVQVLVADNQHVDAGAVIAELDDADYRAKLAAAEADLVAAVAQAEAADAQVDIVEQSSQGGLSSAQAQLRGAGGSVRAAAAQIDAAAAALARARAELTRADADYTRTRNLHDQGAATDQQLEAAETARAQAQSAVDAAAANLAGARNQRTVAESKVAEAAGRVQQSTPVKRQVTAAQAAARLAHARADSARAARDLARLQLGWTRITSPVAGTVSRLAAHEGQMVQPGLTLAMVVPERTYVIANFKETQISRIRPGDPVDISLDAVDGTFHGVVDSIAPGTGSRFSLLPPDNATGNFVKVVQRVPVKITWDDDQDLSQLRAGLSAEVTIHVD